MPIGRFRGKFYVWSKEELEDFWAKDEPLISECYQGRMKETGKTETRSSSEQSCKRIYCQHDLTAEDWANILQRQGEMLPGVKNGSAGLDDKILTAWNAMTDCGLGRCISVSE